MMGWKSVSFKLLRCWTIGKKSSQLQYAMGEFSNKANSCATLHTRAHGLIYEEHVINLDATGFIFFVAQTPVGARGGGGVMTSAYFFFRLTERQAVNQQWAMIIKNEFLRALESGGGGVLLENLGEGFLFYQHWKVYVFPIVSNIYFSSKKLMLGLLWSVYLHPLDEDVSYIICHMKKLESLCMNIYDTACTIG